MALIDTEAFKRKIINLAIQGKLTKQLPEDGTAEELYETIQAEKKALVEAGKIKKEKSLDEIKFDEVPFEIPESWKWVCMGDIFQHNTGKALNSSDTKGELLEYITTSNMYWNHFELDKLKKMRFKPEEIEKCTISKGDLLVCEGGDIGRSAIWNYDYDMRIQNHIHRLRGYLNEKTCAKLYYYLLWFYKQSGLINGRGIGLQGFSSKRLHGLAVPLPPFAEQKRIVEVVETLFAEIDTIKKLQEHYVIDTEILKSKVIDAAIQGKLTEQLPSDGTAEELYQQIQEEKKALIESGKIKKEKPLKEIEEDEIPFEIPESWKWCRIKDIGITVTGSTPPKKQPEYYGGNYPFYKPADLDKGEHIITASEYLTEAGKEVARQFEKGTILVCCIGSIGKCAVIDEDGTANQQINALAPILCNSDYLLYCISSGFFKTQLQQESRATTVSIIKKSKFDTCILPIPPLEEQKRIVDRVGYFLQHCK